MGTRKIIATQEWQQLTDGSTETFIQFTGEITLCRSATKPGNDAPYLRFNNTELTITRSDIVWIRAYWKDADVTVYIW
ncbi:hypothetical protein DO659_24800 [Salmonella enterica subsp. enterica serovar Minnesota]|nr:hypothetical protein [Salmonella enterica subsp. enterica serovar Minnesota]ECI4647669.1 hypothetical protein [Salmonella enterica subsp. salamae]